VNKDIKHPWVVRRERAAAVTVKKYGLLHIQNSVPFVFSLDMLTKTAKKTPSSVTGF